ncbi:MAG: 2-phospho-L-lactate guanylyltransferase [Anaerolineaceae bacterium]|nr:MAG: 2-phospho-L-lactate guanylyltransferase [Anaerolineaceae bacterium]
MTIWAIVPVKPLRRAKSRLSSVLSREERASLSRQMLVHTLEVLSQVPSVERTLVVSRDSRALALAREHNARTVTERGSPQLNQALVRATLLARGYGVSGVLVLPADLPLLTKEGVDQLISMATDPPVVVIAPDRHQKGTNALLSSPPGLIEYDFGPDSFSNHLSHAKTAGVRVEICNLPSFGLDIDIPEDLEAFQEGRFHKLTSSNEE